METPPTQIHEWVYVLSLALPALIAALAVVWQSRKTRKRGTEEHVLGRNLLEQHGDLMIQHGEALNRIESKADRTLWKVDVIDDRVTHLERDARTGRDDAEVGLVEATAARDELRDRVIDHVDAPHGDIREGA